MSIKNVLKRLIFSVSAKPIMDKTRMNATRKKPIIITTIEESTNNMIDIWKNNQDTCEGLEFHATYQLRTPLRILMRHGETHTDINTKPPQIIKEKWEGIWVIKTGIDINSLLPGIKITAASDIGYILPKDYVPFLVAIRKIAELDDSIESRIEKLRNMPAGLEWKSFIKRHGGIENIIDIFFPIFIDTIPHLNFSTKKELYKLGLNTPNLIESSSDDNLLRIKGIGKEKLKAIRKYCSSITNYRDADRIDNVIK